jgi:NAD(P)-dependent dehydrogenase (short-subunit alcohol dehydrogenase family)
MNSTPKTWFITGTSRGFGRIWTEAALARGDRVAATARNPETLASLKEQYGDQILALKLDVQDKAAVEAAVGQAHAHFGRLDVVLNNAGYGLLGMVEEASEAQVREQLETNVFGALWVTQAALPFLRAQRSGHIIQISSIGGVTSLPMFGIYNASKWALEGFSQALATEVRDFGIKITLVEPTAYATEWSGASADHATAMDAYAGLRGDLMANWADFNPGDPRATAEAMLTLADAEQPPLRVFFGDGLVEMMKHEYEERIATWSEWSGLSKAAINGEAA